MLKQNIKCDWFKAPKWTSTTSISFENINCDNDATTVILIKGGMQRYPGYYSVCDECYNRSFIKSSLKTDLDISTINDLKNIKNILDD